MILPPAVAAWCREKGHGEITGREPVAGGCINNGARLYTSSGAAFFLKWNPQAPPDMFACEAAGLKALTVPEGPRVPAPHLAGPDFLLLEDLRPAARSPDYWADFGRQLAAVHAIVGTAFGFEHNNYLGTTPQPNAWTEDGHEFFAEQRLLHQARLALQNGHFNRGEYRQAETIAHRLKELVPPQPPSLIHGDLWSGNATTGATGEPALIDPAAHYGWAEAELGMTQLFGGFPAEFYDSYVAHRPLDPGWRDRLDLYNLYHILNHLNLFGASYLGQARALLQRFA